MKEFSNNIFPVPQCSINREKKELFLKQKAKVIWMTGLSGAGKTTIAYGLETELFNRGFLTHTLDGDNIRSGINKDLGFSKEDRNENLRRVAELSKIFLNCGIVTISSFITPTNKAREEIRKIVGKENLIEVYINASLEVCKKRDTKGLYQKARTGELKDFTGISSPFDVPINHDIEINTMQLSIKESIGLLVDYVIRAIERY